MESPYTIPGVSDGGAHTKFLTAGSYPTDFLMWMVRDTGKITLEEAHYRLSYLPARAGGFTNRGALVEGAPADVVVYTSTPSSSTPSSRERSSTTSPEANGAGSRSPTATSGSSSTEKSPCKTAKKPEPPPASSSATAAADAPISRYRGGVSQFSKAAIDRLGKRLRDSETPDPADVAAYIEWSATFEEPLRATLDIIDAACERAGVSLDEKTSRIKQLYSIVAKLRRGHPRLSSIDDIAGCRAVVEREADVNALVLQLATAQVKRVRDYRQRDRNGYRAVHLTLVNDSGQAVELQLRTEIQHVWAGVVGAKSGDNRTYGQVRRWASERAGPSLGIVQRRPSVGLATGRTRCRQ